MRSAWRKVTGPREAYAEINAILRGSQPGDRLPSYPRLKARLGLTQRSLDMAYARMEEEGVIRREHGRGTFVVDPYAGGVFAFVGRDFSFATERGVYVRLLYVALNELIHRLSPSSSLELVLLPTGDALNDPAEDEEMRKRLGNLGWHARILGVFCGHSVKDGAARSFLEEQQIPLVDGSLECGIHGAPFGEAAKMGLDHLIEQGWQNTVVTVRTREEMMDYELAIKGMGHCGGTQCRIRVLCVESVRRSDRWSPGAAFIKDLLDRDLLPEAFFVADDTLCRSMIRGALDRGVFLAERCALVTISNKGVPIYASRELTRLEYDAADFADAMMKSMQESFQGMPVHPRIVMPKLIIGETSRRSDYCEAGGYPERAAATTHTRNAATGLVPVDRTI